MNNLAIAIAPVAIILFYIYSKDKYDKEPLKLIFKIMLFGALACIPAAMLELILAGVFIKGEATPVGIFLYSFIGIALVEEGLKFLVLYLITWKNENFNEPFDGIVYAVSVSLGFAALENILFVAGGGFGVGITRAFTAIPMHAVLGVLMGYYYGKARFDTQGSGALLSLCLVVPVAFHGIYDFLALMSATGIPGLFMLLILLLIGLVIVAFRIVKSEADKKEMLMAAWLERQREQAFQAEEENTDV